MLPATVIFAAFTYLLMLAGYLRPHWRWFHIPIMISVIVFDVGMPFYLYTHRDWWHRLIEQQDILSFLVWMHFGLLVMLYALDATQIYTATRILKGHWEARQPHHTQGKALLLVRGLVIVTGAVLANPT